MIHESALARLYSPQSNGCTEAEAATPRTLTVRDVITAYLAHKQAEHAAGLYTLVSLQRTRHYLGSFARRYGEQVIAECKASDLAAWIVANPQWRSPHTRLDAAGTVITCFRWAEREPLIDKSPYRHGRQTTWESPSPRAAMRTDEYQRIMAMARSCNGRGKRSHPSRLAFRRCLWALWQTGMRTCESREIGWEHVDWDAGCAVLRKHKTAKVTGENRIIPLRRVVVRWLRWLWQSLGCPASGVIFRNGRGKVWTRRTFGRQYKKYARMANVREEVTSYSCRHSFCCRALEAGVGERQVADALGHRQTNLVSWYGRTLRNKVSYLRASVERIDRKVKHE